MIGSLRFTMPTRNPMTPKIGVAGILRRADGRVLLARRGHAPNQDQWAFPGGRLEFQEPLARGVVREFWEETGIRVRCGDLVYAAEIFDGDSVHYVVLDYVVYADTFSAHAGSDAAALTWAGPNEWQALPLAVGMKDALKDFGVRRQLRWPAS